MNESQIKLKIILIRSIDWILFAVVLGVGIPALIYTKEKLMSLLFIMVGLGIVNLSGNWTVKKVASLRLELEKLERKEKSGF